MNNLRRSETYQRIFDDKRIVDAFGKLNPNSSERTVYFFEKWCDWYSNRVNIESPNTNTIYQIKLILEGMGLDEFWDYQIRNREIRFSDAEMLAFFKISSVTMLG